MVEVKRLHELERELEQAQARVKRLEGALTDMVTMATRLGMYKTDQSEVAGDLRQATGKARAALAEVL